MRVGLVFLGVGVAALILRGVAAVLLPMGWCPDLGLLVVIGMGLHLPGATGLLLAALLGYAGDILAGSLMGQHALLWVLSFVATRIAGGQVDLHRGGPYLIFVAVVTLANGIGLVALTRFFAGQADWPTASLLAIQALVNAAVALPIGTMLSSLARSLSEDPRRPVELAMRRRAV